MEVVQTEMEGVLLVKPGFFEDHRGEYCELYNEELYASKGIRTRFVQDDISMSSKDVLRGIHGDGVTTKLVTCLLGRFYLVIVDCDEASPSFGKWQSFTLTDQTRHQVLIPPKHGVGHLALTDRVMFHYKQSTTYDPSSQFTYKWNDPRFGIWWPISDPILSRRDQVGHYV